MTEFRAAPGLDSATQRRLNALFTEHTDVLRGCARKLCCDQEEASDLFQDTLKYALEHHGKLLAHPAPRNWLLTVLKHFFLDRCRRMKPDRLSEAELARMPAQPFEEEPAWVAVSTVEFEKAIAQLPNELRVAYELKAFRGLKIREIAEVLGKPKGTIGVQVARAKKFLRQRLFPQPGEMPGGELA